MPLLTGQVLVCKEVVFQPVNCNRRTVGYIIVFSVDSVVIENTYNFIISLIAVYHTNSSYRPCSYQDVPVGNVFFGQDADIHCVTVTFNVTDSRPFHAEFRHFVTCYCSWDKTVKRRNNIAVPLGTIEPQVTGDLVHLIFDGISRHHLHKGHYHKGGSGS